MSVRAVAIRQGSGHAVRGIPAARPRVVPRDLRPRRWEARPGILARLTDDRDLIALKFVLLGILFVVSMILEVPP